MPIGCSSVRALLTMEHWQFLIQKQGDRTWQSLEPPNLKILAGRYRVLARSNLPNTDVEVRVTHVSSQDFPPKRRIIKRSRRTNAEGLMAIIPFTFLQPGIWELRCSGDLMSDILGKSWQYKVLVQVMPQELDGQPEEQLSELETSPESAESNIPDYLDSLSDPEPKVITQDHSGAIPAELAIARQSNLDIVSLATKTAEDIDQPVSPVWLKGETAEQILQNLIDLALPIIEPLVDSATVDNSPTTSPSLLQLTLNQETYIARWGEALTINGRAELPAMGTLESEISSLERLWALELVIELRSPLESKILTQVRQILPDQVLPFTFSTLVDIPAEDDSKLILADISLYGALTDIGEVKLLGSKSFTITADLTELLTIAQQQSNPADILHTSSLSKTLSATTEPSVSLDLELFNLVKTPKTSQSQSLNPSPKKPLPPRIKPRVLVSILDKSADGCWPQLPKLPVSQTAESPTQKQVVAKTRTIPTIDLEQLVIKPRRPILETTFPYLKRLKAVPGDQEEVNSNLLEDSQQLEAIVSEDSNTPELVTVDAQLRALPVAEVELVDESVAQNPIPPSSESIKAEEPPSPLLRKWMQSQGYTLPEPINVGYQDDDIYVPTPQAVSAPSQETPIVDDLSLNQDSAIATTDADLPLNQDSAIATTDADLPLNPDSAIATEDSDLSLNPDSAIATEDSNLPLNPDSEIEIGNEDAGDVSEDAADLPPQIPQLPPSGLLKIQSRRLAQEIVVDDTDELTSEVINSHPPEAEVQLLSDLPMTGEKVESLPIPQLYVPEGELIAGTSVRVRVELPEAHPQVVVKLWVEDYQTRWLLDGPHLLTNLLPSSLGGLEVMTQLNIPFGCLEIRLEAIALDMTTRQESHKVTIVRTVIPPDLPTFQLDELLDM
ncbi:hypothetical protein NIES4074_11720 [Cylindrospermum sp. NIES-4074]|nr:hypothetical protein NIES4074_11720 [Cylindrospermum sp. NIES-4074]